MLKCGFYEMEITPHIGGNMPGYGAFKKRVSNKITDPLYVHAFAACSGEQTIMILSLDALAIEKEESDRIREGISRMTGVSAEQIGIAATHTHTGGAVKGRMTFAYKQEEYCDFLVKRAIDAGYMAFLSMEEAKIGTFSQEIEGLSFSRRFQMKDGRVDTNPGVMNPEVAHAVGVVDKELLMLRVDRMDGTPMGVIVNFALHPDSAGSAGESYKTAYSADFPGVIRTNLRKVYGENFSFVFLLGACGNVNHLNVFKPRAEQKDFRMIGNALSEIILEALPKIETRDVDKVRCTSTIFTGVTRRPTWEDVERQLNPMRKKAVMMAYGLPDEEIQVEVWTAMLGDSVIQMFPGELFADFSLDIKKQSEGVHSFICTLGNDSLGYIYTKEAQEQGGYEPGPNLGTKMNSDTGYRMVEAAIANVKRLKER